jgi:hypothetical protein
MIPFHRGLDIQRGRGIGNLFGGIFKRLLPLARAGIHAGKRVLQSDYTKSLARSSLDLGKDILTNAGKNIIISALEGGNVNAAAKNELNRARKRIGDALKGKGRKRKLSTSLINISQPRSSKSGRFINPQELEYNLLS